MIDIHFPLSEEFTKFVMSHLHDDTARLRLEYHNKELPFDVDFAITQIECRRKFGSKIPSFVHNPRFIFPTVVSGEQATNEFVARFHSSLIDKECTEIYDCTAGLGIDSLIFAESGRSVYAVEMDLFKQQCLHYNAEIFQHKNLRALCADSTILFASGSFRPGTVVFIDPHRRDASGGRTYGLSDCQPDVTKLLPRWEGEKVKVFLKLSPMLDVDKTLNDLPWSTALWAVCYKGECKEILVSLEMSTDRKPNPNAVSLYAIDLSDNGIISEFECSREFSKIPAPLVNDLEEIGECGYLYIPSAAMMKLGAWGAISARFPSLMKLSGSTPLYISPWYYRTFPGRVVMIDSVIGSGQLKKMKGEKMTVITRNYPLTADQLRKKAALKEGDSKYLVGAGVGRKAKPTLFLCSAIRDEDLSSEQNPAIE